MTCIECKGRGFITVGAVMVEEPQRIQRIPCPKCGGEYERLKLQRDAIEERQRDAVIADLRQQLDVARSEVRDLRLRLAELEKVQS